MDDLQATWLSGGERAHRRLDAAVRGWDRGSWAVGVLLAGIHATGRQDCADAELNRIVDIGLDPARWSEAHDAFSGLRQVTLRFEREGGETVCRLLIDLAESAAKVIYNAGDNPAPFDIDSGERLVARAAALAACLDRAEATDMIWHAVARVPNPPR